MKLTYLDLVGQNEIADRAGVKVGTVRAWRQRHDGFPPPLAQLVIGPVWDWPEVEDWLSRERPPGRPSK